MELWAKISPSGACCRVPCRHA